MKRRRRVREIAVSSEGRKEEHGKVLAKGRGLRKRVGVSRVERGKAG